MFSFKSLSKEKAKTKSMLEEAEKLLTQMEKRKVERTHMFEESIRSIDEQSRKDLKEHNLAMKKLDEDRVAAQSEIDKRDALISQFERGEITATQLNTRMFNN